MMRSDLDGLINMVTWEKIIPVGEFRWVEDIGDGAMLTSQHHSK